MSRTGPKITDETQFVHLVPGDPPRRVKTKIIGIEHMETENEEFHSHQSKFWIKFSCDCPLESKFRCDYPPRITIRLDRMIVLSKSSLLGWFLPVSLIVIIKGRSPIEVSLIRRLHKIFILS
jgi:hypothetical protein